MTELQSNHFVTSDKFDEKIITYLMKKYKLGSIDATCVYYDVLTSLATFRRESNEP